MLTKDYQFMFVNMRSLKGMFFKSKRASETLRKKSSPRYGPSQIDAEEKTHAEDREHKNRHSR